MAELVPLEWVKRHLELLSYKWTPRTKAKMKARRLSQLTDKRVKYQYQCNHCKEWFKDKETQLDHIVPKGRYSKETFFVWLERLLCKESGFQVLCRPCHLVKTNSEHKNGAYK